MASTSAAQSGDRDEIRQKIEDNKDKIEELRSRFSEEISQDDPDSPYDPRDFDWMSSSDAYMYHVLLISQMDVDKGFEKLCKILTWRKEFGVNDMTFDMFPEDLQQMGGLYPHGTDKQGRRILWYRVKHYQKGQESQMWAKKMTVFWLNRLQKEDPEHRIVVIEDMSGAGVSNMDIDLIRFKIQCFELYFPALVDMLYICDMPWILNTLWRLVEKILSQQARDHIKFVRGKEIQTHIPQASLPTHLGGTDTYEWIYIPEQDNELENEEEEEEGAERIGNASFRSMDGDSDRSLLPLVNAARSSRQPKQPKKVHFEDETNGKENIDPENSPPHRKHRKHGNHIKRGKSKDSHIGPLVTIRPGELLIFEPPSSISGSEGITASLTVTNTTDKKVVYKVKTTTPERYKVRPSMGPINPGSSIHITVTLLSGPGETVVRDKFLILSSEPGDMSFRATSEISQYWKNVKPEDMVEHRMSCVFSPVTTAKGNTTDKPDKHIQLVLNKLKSMDDQISELKRQNSRLMWLQTLVLFITTFLLVYLFFFRPHEGAVLSAATQSSQCLEASEKFLRGAREGL